MILIEEIINDNLKVKFYKGIDFNVVLKHPKDGSAGLLFFFIENWESEVKSWERNSKIESAIEHINFEKLSLDNIENDYLIIYQIENVPVDVMYKITKDKLINGVISSHPWIPVSGIDKGAWRIGKTRLLN